MSAWHPPQIFKKSKNIGNFTYICFFNLVILNSYLPMTARLKPTDRQLYKVLIVDDHPIIVDGYKNVLKVGLDDPNLFIDTAYNCEEAVNIILSESGDYDIIILDINLPPYKKLKLNSGEDLGMWIRKEFPEIKLFVLTCHSDALRINSICHNLSPEGFLIKSEATTKDVVSAFKDIQNNKVALGPTVSQLLLRKSHTYYHLDTISLEILREISNGTRTIDLPKYIPLSKSGIEKRKRLLKSFFDVKSNTDRELVINARNNGYL